MNRWTTLCLMMAQMAAAQAVPALNGYGNKPSHPAAVVQSAPGSSAGAGQKAAPPAQPGAVTFGPPVCPGAKPALPHPTAAQIVAAAEKAAADPTVLITPEPVGNMGLLRYQVRDYADCGGTSGCYWADLDAGTRRALDLLEFAHNPAPQGEKLALVLDIDETALSSYCEEVREDFGYIPDRFETWITSLEASIPIPGTVRLAARAQKLGVAVFFITGRPESQRAPTERNLRAAGYNGWQGLSLRPAGDGAVRTTAEYKAAERQKIADAGYRVLLNMGDQWSDLQGTPLADHSIKLPNPFYYLP